MVFLNDTIAQFQSLDEVLQYSVASQIAQVFACCGVPEFQFLFIIFLLGRLFILTANDMWTFYVLNISRYFDKANLENIIKSIMQPT